MEAWQIRIGKLEAWKKQFVRLAGQLMTGKLGATAWQNTWPPPAGRNFGRMKLLAPPKN